MEKKRIKVVWITEFSNTEIREQLHFIERGGRFLKKNPLKDLAQWNTNAIREFKKFEDVELHVISPHKQLAYSVEEFVKENIHYHFFRSEDDRFVFRLKRKILKGKYLTPEYKNNTRTILSFIDSIKPDIIHLIGAENPYYSISALSISKNIPLIVALQTLMIAPGFFENYPISREQYEYRSGIERKVLERADYISIRGERFIEILNKEIKPIPKILEMPLAVGEDVTIANYEKLYDFVYFAKEIEKAADWAIESFSMVCKVFPNVTLRIIGGYGSNFKQQLDKRLVELKISNNVSFTGSLPTHNDVLNEVRKARFALLPLKVDLISGTIREAMANGLPVVTTITPATPKFNVERKSLLLSEKEDFKAMADNMCRLLEEKGLADMLRNNAVQTLQERYSNAAAMQQWRDSYYRVLKEFKKNTN